MKFHQLFDADSSTHSYLLIDGHEAVIIDPVKEHAEEYLVLLEQNGARLKYALDTHTHADHITAAGLLRDKTGCQTAVSSLSKAECASLRLKDGDSLQFGAQTIHVLHTPGHTPCSVSFVMEDRVFTGDTLLINGCGRTDFQQGSSEDLWRSVTEKLFSLSGATTVYPGHDYHGCQSSTIAQEKATNPRFANKTREEFVELMKNLNLSYPQKMHEALPANEKCGMKD